MHFFSRPQAHFRSHPTSRLTVLFCLAVVLGAMLLGPAAVSAKYDYWIWKAHGWQDRNESLKGNLIRQMVAPGNQAFVEIYSQTAANPGLQNLADRWEASARQNNLAYARQRVNQDRGTVPYQVPMVIRRYTGQGQGTALGSTVLFTYHQGRYWIVVGVYAQGGGFRNLVERSVLSLRFIPPGQDKPSGSAAGASGSTAQQARLWLDKTTFRPGERFNVHFQAPPGYNSSAWIGLIPANVSHGSESNNDRYDVAYIHLKGRTSGTLPFTAPNKPGAWTVRLNDNDSGGRETASVGFTVISNTGSGVSGGGGAVSGGVPCSIVGRWKWFTGSEPEFLPDGRVKGSSNSRWYCRDAGQGIVVIEWNNRQYIDTLYLKNNGNRLEGKNQYGNSVWGNRLSGPAVSGGSGAASVAGSGSSSQQARLWLDKTTFRPGERISVHFQAPAGYHSSAWIGIIPAIISHGSEKRNDQYDVSYQHLKGRTSGTMFFTAPSKPDRYTFRLNDNDSGGRETASVRFIVTSTGSGGGGASSMPGAQPSGNGTSSLPGSGEGSGAAQAAGFSYVYIQPAACWIKIPAGWPHESDRDKSGGYLFKAHRPEGKAGIIVWYNDIGENWTADQLADLWEKQTRATQPYMASRAERPRISRVNTQLRNAPMIVREYSGQMKNTATQTYVGYATNGSRAYTVTAIYPRGEGRVEYQVRQSVLSFRLVRPTASQIQSTAGLITVN